MTLLSRVLGVRWFTLVGLVALVGLLSAPAPAAAQDPIDWDLEIDFDFDAGGAPVIGTQPLGGYLSGFGVTVQDVTPGTELTIVDDFDFVDEFFIITDTSPNVLAQIRTDDQAGEVISYTMVLPEPAYQARFTRAGFQSIVGFEVDYPAWAVEALDVDMNPADDFVPASDISLASGLGGADAPDSLAPALLGDFVGTPSPPESLSALLLSDPAGTSTASAVSTSGSSALPSFNAIRVTSNGAGLTGDLQLQSLLFDSLQVQYLSSLVPEPTGAVLLCAGLPWALRRRRHALDGWLGSEPKA